MSKNRRHQLNAARSEFNRATSQLSADEKQMTELVMGAAFKRMAQRYKGKRLSNDEADEILANIIVEVMEEQKTAAAQREQEVLMVAAINTVPTNAPPVLSLDQVVATAGDHDDEQPAAIPGESYVTMQADENGVYWPTVSYVKGQTPPVQDARLEAEIVVHPTDEAATQSFAQRVYNTMMGKLRASTTPSTPESTTADAVAFPEPDFQPQAADTATETTMNSTNTTETNDTPKLSLWDKVKAFCSSIADKISAYFAEVEADAETAHFELRHSGQKVRAYTTLVLSAATTYVVGYIVLVNLGVFLISTTGLLGAILFVGLVLAWYLGGFVPAMCLVYRTIHNTINLVTGLFSKSAPVADAPAAA
jgi:hypothetical protein